jgi:hypothetical protein
MIRRPRYHPHMPVTFTPKNIDAAARAFREIEGDETKLGIKPSTDKVLKALNGLSPEEVGATLDFINQGSDHFNLQSLRDLFEGSPAKSQFLSIIDAPAAKDAFVARQKSTMVESDVDQTLLDGKQKAFPGMKAVLDALGDQGGNTHVISARVEALGLATDIALKAGNIRINSTAFGSIKGFNDAGIAHLEDLISKLGDGHLKAKLVAKREGHYDELGGEKFKLAQQRMAANPQRKADFLGDDVEGDMYLFSRLLKDDDSRAAAGKPSQLGLTMLHVVSGKDIPQRLKDELAKPDGKVILYKDAKDLASQLAARGRIDAGAQQKIVDDFNAGR